MPPQLPQVTAETDDGFVDLTFNVIGEEPVEAGLRVHAAGLHQHRQVGFQAIIHQSWEEKPLDGIDQCLYWGLVTLGSSGQESDVLIQTLDDLYGTSLRPAAMTPLLVCQAVGLADDPRQVLTRPTRMKLFLAPVHNECYAEIYFNIDIPQGRAELCEKDPYYRRNVVRCFAGLATTL